MTTGMIVQTMVQDVYDSLKHIFPNMWNGNTNDKKVLDETVYTTSFYPDENLSDGTPIFILKISNKEIEQYAADRNIKITPLF